MTEIPKPDFSDLTKLAVEACDLWQEHLSTFTQNPDHKTTLLRMMEPQRHILSSLFAEYTSMMQNSQYGSSAHETSSNETNPPSSPRADESAPGATASSAASHDIALRVAQLAHRVAQLEQQIAKLEERLVQTRRSDEPGPRKTPRASKKH